MYFTQEQYNRMKMSNEQAEKVAHQYLSHDMKELKSIVNQLIKKKKMPKSFSEDLMIIGEDVFIQSIYTYNPESKASFKTFLWGNIWRKFWTYRRDVTNPCRCVLEPEIDEETKEYKRDKKGKVVMRPLFDVSMYSTKTDGDSESELWEWFKSDVSVEDTVILQDKKGELKDETLKFVNNLSKPAKEVALYIIDGLSKDVIISYYGISTEQYNNAIEEFRMFENIHILLGGR